MMLCRLTLDGASRSLVGSLEDTATDRMRDMVGDMPAVDSQRTVVFVDAAAAGRGPVVVAVADHTTTRTSTGDWMLCKALV
jgi:hypothetical protein